MESETADKKLGKLNKKSKKNLAKLGDSRYNESMDGKM